MMRLARIIIDYSRGMKKKVALAAAIIHAPDVLFLDEPFEGVDAVSARLIRTLLQRYTRKRRDRRVFLTRDGPGRATLHAESES